MGTNNDQKTKDAVAAGGDPNPPTQAPTSSTPGVDAGSFTAPASPGDKPITEGGVAAADAAIAPDHRDDRIAELESAAASHADVVAAKDARIEELEKALEKASAAKPKAARTVAGVKPVQASPDVVLFASGSSHGGVSFDLDGDDVLSNDSLWEIVSTGPAYILLGDDAAGFVEVPAIETTPEHWARNQGRAEFIGNVKVTGANTSPGGLQLLHFGLAEKAKGPIVARCEVPGGAALQPGREFNFGRGQILFGA